MIPANHTDLDGAVWRKARSSDSGQGCIEVADLGGGRIGLRDSKHPDEPAHVFTRFELACFLDGARNGEFDDLAS